MDIHTIRRRRVRQIIDEQFRGVDAQFAARIERSPTQVARWFMTTSNRRDIGEDLARDIETKLKLPRGWIDTDPDAATPTAQQPLGIYNIAPEIQQHLLDLFDHLTEPQQHEVLDELTAKKLSNEAIYQKISGRLKHVTRERAAEKLPPAPKSKIDQ